MSLRPTSLLRFVLLFLCSLSLFSFTFFPKSVQAFDSPITIIAQADTVHFPTSIDFTLTANDSANAITSATIYITYKDVPFGGDGGSYSVPISKPAQRVTLDYHDDTSQISNFHSPGTPIEYYWVLQDSASRQFVDLPQDFSTVDTRFSWQHLTQGLLQVNWYNRPADFGRVLLSKANDSITHISTVLGSGLQRPINLWVYASNGDFHGALAPNSYEWVGGEAHPYLNEAFISVVDISDDTLIRDMPHELTHLVFHQLITQGPVPPTWFDEGLAVYNQLYHEPDMRARFELALSTKSLLRLYKITDGFPSDADQAYLAYAQSWDLISYMYKTFGQAKMTRLIQNMNNGQNDFDQQLTQSIGLDSLHLENQWLLSLGQASVITPDSATPTTQPLAQTTQNTTPTDNTTPILVTTGILLIFLPLMCIVAIVIYQRRKRQRVLAVSAAQNYAGTPNGTPFYVPQQPYPPFQGNGSFNYSNPAQYPAPFQQGGYAQSSAVQPPLVPRSVNLPQTYMPFSYPEADQAYSRPAQLSPQPQSLPHLPTGQQHVSSNGTNTSNVPWTVDFSGTNDGQNGVNGTHGNASYSSDTYEAPAESFGSFQEGIQQQPRKQAPQD